MEQRPWSCLGPSGSAETGTKHSLDFLKRKFLVNKRSGRFRHIRLVSAGFLRPHTDSPVTSELTDFFLKKFPCFLMPDTSFYSVPSCHWAFTESQLKSAKTHSEVSSSIPHHVFWRGVESITADTGREAELYPGQVASSSHGDIQRPSPIHLTVMLTVGGTWRTWREPTQPLGEHTHRKWIHNHL